jgi:hypothetical protein
MAKRKTTKAANMVNLNGKQTNQKTLDWVVWTPLKNQGWAQVLRKGEQFLRHKKRDLILIRSQN